MKDKYFIIIIVVLILLLIFGQISSNRLKDNIETKDSIIKEQNSSIKIVKLKNGTLAYDKTRAEGDLESLMNGYKWLEDSLKELGIKAKDLESALFVAQQTIGAGIGTIDTVRVLESDTVYRIGKILITEPYFVFSANLYDNNQYKYTYSVFDSLSIVKTSHRKNIFSKYEYTIRVVNANPKTTISGVTSLTIKEKPYKFAVSVIAGYGITKSGLSPYIGIGISKPLIKFR